GPRFEGRSEVVWQHAVLVDGHADQAAPEALEYVHRRLVAGLLDRHRERPSRWAVTADQLGDEREELDGRAADHEVTLVDRDTVPREQGEQLRHELRLGIGAD